MADNIFTSLLGSLRRAVGRDPAPPPVAPTHDAAPPAHVDAPPPPPPDLAPTDDAPVGVGDALAVQQGIQAAPLSVPHVDPDDDGPIGVGDALATAAQSITHSVVPHVDPVDDGSVGAGGALATSAQSIAQHIVDDVVDDVVVNLGTAQANTGPNLDHVQIITGDPMPPTPAPEFPPEDVSITTGDAMPPTPGDFGAGASPSPSPASHDGGDPGFGSGASIPMPHVGGTDFGIPLPPDVAPVLDPAEVAPSAPAPMPAHHDAFDDDGTDPGGMTDHSVSDGVDGAADDI